jgi:hypothetical protein
MPVSFFDMMDSVIGRPFMAVDGKWPAGALNHPPAAHESYAEFCRPQGHRYGKAARVDFLPKVKGPIVLNRGRAQGVHSKHP